MRPPVPTERGLRSHAAGLGRTDPRQHSEDPPVVRAEVAGERRFPGQLRNTVIVGPRRIRKESQ